MRGDAGAHDAGADHGRLLDGHLCGLQDGGDALAAADALRRERELLALALQQGRRLAGDARAGGAQRVAERDGAAVEVGLVEVEAELVRSEEHTSELQSLMRISYAVFCLKKKTQYTIKQDN